MAEDEEKQTAHDEAAEKVTEKAAEDSAAAENTEKTATAGEAGKAEEAGAAEDAGQAGGDAEKEETVAGDAEEKKEIEPLEDIDTEWEAEKLCRWGAARASVLVVAPVFGTMALIANEVYMITRLADLRGVKVSEGTALGLLGSLGATFIGQSVFTLLPIPAIQIPLAVSITYGVGKAANAWLKAGRPEDVAKCRHLQQHGLQGRTAGRRKQEV